MKKINFIIIAFTLFTAFTFAQDEKEVVVTKNDSVDVPFSVIEQIPIFSGCEFTEKEFIKQKECFNIKMNEHVKANFRYPSKAIRKKIQGRVVVMFVINKEGNIENIKARAPEGCELLEEEAIRIISLLPKFKPGIQKGVPVKVSYSQPIIFRIDR